MSRPQRQIVERIADEEARAARVRLEDVLGTCRLTRVAKARRIAICRIVQETGCTAYGLAMVWGCGMDTVRRALGGAPQKGYAKPRDDSGPRWDLATIDRLTWQHGPERAAAIIDGIDPSTIEDIAAWRRLGSARA